MKAVQVFNTELKVSLKLQVLVKPCKAEGGAQASQAPSNPPQPNPTECIYFN